MQLEENPNLVKSLLWIYFGEEYHYTFRLIGKMVRVFTNGQGSISGRVIPKTQKMVLDASLLNIQHFKVRIKSKVEKSRERIAPSPTPWCSSYRKGNLRVTLDYGRQLLIFVSSDDFTRLIWGWKTANMDYSLYISGNRRKYM